MSDENDDVKTAASKLTDAMSGLLRAIDAAPDQAAVARDLPDDLSEQLQRLVTRLDAALGFSG